MFLRGPSTKTSLTFLASIMVLEILNNVGKPFFGEKFSLSHHFAESILVFVPKIPIYKNLSQFFHSDFIMRDTCASLQAIFQTL